MKSERRHELQHNALLDWLVETHTKIKPHLNVIFLGLIVLLVGALAYTWMSRQSADTEATAWDSVFLAMGMGDTAQLDDTVDQYPKTTAAQWALVVSGDLHLTAGCEELFTTKATAADELQKAQDSYTRVLDSCREDVVRERATYGLARCYEAMAGTRSQGDLKLAVENYEKILTEWPEGAYAAAAQARIDALSQMSTKRFYDGLAAWEPRPAFASPEGLDDMNLPFDQPGAGLDVGGEPKDFFGDITKRVDESIEDAKEGEATDEDAPADGAAEVDAPAMPEATGEPPAEDAPADTTEEGTE